MSERDGSRRTLSLFDATLLVMGGIIGVGVFFNPQGVAQEVSSVATFLGLWAFGGLIALTGAMTFAELAASLPNRGGWFVFLREAFGAFPAFLFAWIVLFIVSTGASAVIAEFFADQVCTLLWGRGAAPDGAGRWIGAAALFGITALAFLGTKVGALFQNACMLAKLAAIGTLALAGLTLALPDGASAVEPAVTAGTTGWDNLVRASLSVLFSYGGWQFITYIAPEVRDPQRTLPRAILLGVAGVIVVYVAVNAAFVRVLTLEGVATIDGFAAEMARRTLGTTGERVLVAGMAVSSIGVCTVILIATPGIYVAMAREGLFFDSFARLHPRTAAPVLALCVQLAVVLAYYFWSSARVLVDAVVFTEWIFHFLAAWALLRLRRRRPDLPRPFKSFAYPLFPLLYAAIAALVVIGTLVGAIAGTGRQQTAIGLTVLGVGSVVFLPWRRFFARD